jgi:serine/threonine protein kinase
MVSAPNPPFSDAEDVDPLLGAVVEGRFELLERIDAGPMGVVYKAEQKPLGRPVAFEVLHPGAGADETFAKRFFLEAAAAARLAHPHTVVVYDYGQTADGTFFLAREHLEGVTLSEYLRRVGPLAPARAIHVGAQIASSLLDAHQQGLVHGDLEPGKVMFVERGGDPFFTKVLGYGLGRTLGGRREPSPLPRDEGIVGSPRSGSPEEIGEASLDPRGDIRGFGALLFHCVAGPPPPAAGTPVEAIAAHVAEDGPRLPTAWPECPAGPQLEDLVLQCLEDDPAARPESMEAVLARLRAAAVEAGGHQPASSLDGPRGSISPTVQGAGVVARAAPVKSVPREDPSLAPSAMEPELGGASSPRDAHGAMRSSLGGVSPETRPGAQTVVLAVIGLLLVLGVTGGGIVLGIALAPSPPALPPARPAPTPARAEAPPAEAAAVVLDTAPSGAEAYRGEVILGSTPIDLPIREDERWEVTLRLAGHVDRTVTLSGSHRRRLTVQLEAEPAEEPATRDRRRRREAPPLALRRGRK